MKMIALHEIVRGAGAKRETISPKAEFSVTEDERAELLALGAAVDAVSEEAPKAKAKGKAKEQAESEDSVM